MKNQDVYSITVTQINVRNRLNVFDFSQRLFFSFFDFTVRILFIAQRGHQPLSADLLVH